MPKGAQKRLPRRNICGDFDNTQAFQEGWALFNDGDIQRLDEAEIFQSDIEAVRFIASQAFSGSAYHQSALACGLQYLAAQRAKGGN